MYRLLAVGAVVLAFVVSGSQASAGPLISAGQGSLVPIPPSYWETRGCDHNHPTRVSYRVVKRALRNEYPLKDGAVERLRRFAVCVQTRAKSKAVWDYVRRSLKWRRTYQHVWPIRLNGLPVGWVQWARNITMCESRWDRYASNGSHFSYFQWASGTWASASAGWNAPASPYSASWPHQAVIAIHWAWAAGTSQWSCSG